MTNTKFLKSSIDILSNTPKILNNLLNNSNPEILDFREAENTWSSKQVVAHLLDTDKYNWIIRFNVFQDPNEGHILGYNRFSRLDNYKEFSIEKLLIEFESTRARNVSTIHKANLSNDDLNKTKTHSILGEVSLHNLISTWAAHDLSHINQICRVMCMYYSNELGVWSDSISIIKNNKN